MIRNVLAALVGIMIGVGVIFLVEAAGNAMYPKPQGLDRADHAQMEAYAHIQPMGAFLMVLTAWAVGSFACGMTIGFVSNSTDKTASFLAGLFLLTAAIVELFSSWHPLWMIIIGIAMFIPLTLAGHFVANRFRQSI